MQNKQPSKASYNFPQTVSLMMLAKTHQHLRSRPSRSRTSGPELDLVNPCLTERSRYSILRRTSRQTRFSNESDKVQHENKAHSCLTLTCGRVEKTSWSLTSVSSPKMSSETTRRLLQRSERSWKKELKLFKKSARMATRWTALMFRNNCHGWFGIICLPRRWRWKQSCCKAMTNTQEALIGKDSVYRKSMPKLVFRLWRWLQPKHELTER